MDKYESWLSKGWKKLNDDYLKGSFEPQNESDIKCHLYHTLLQTKSQINGISLSHVVLSEFSGPSFQERFDLVVGREKKRKNVFHPRLLVEIKETSRNHLAPDKVAEIEDDVDKLRRYRKMLEKEGKTEILKYLKTPVVALFFRCATKQGIGTGTNHEMKNLQRKYNDVILLWGPC